MRGPEDRESALLIDVSEGRNSAQAIHLVESFMEQAGLEEKGERIDLYAGNLLLTQGILAKIKQIIKTAGFHLETIYSVVPQTQQAALDEGFFVKEKPFSSQSFSVQTITEPLVDKENLHMDKPKGLRASKDLKTEEADYDESTTPTLYLKQNLRSGKVVRFDGNIIIIGDAHAGSEISAAGDITVWGELRGIAHAGTKGNYRAEIRALRIEAIQLRIADFIARRPDRIFYHKDANGQATHHPELAKVMDGEIKIIQEVIGR
jgi:septum site-determining protein MinC